MSRIVDSSRWQGDTTAPRWSTAETVFLTVLLSVTLVSRLFLSGAGTLSGDMQYWVRWSQQLTTAPLSTFYERTGADYLPIYPYILWLIARLYEPIAQLGSIAGFTIPHDTLYKLPAIVADFATVWLIYVAGRKWAAPFAGATAACVYAMNPAIIANSARWGQVDSIPAFFMVLGLVLFLDQRVVLCGIALAISVLTKPTALVLFPLIIVLMVRRRQVGPLFLLVASFLVTSLAILWPFVPAGIDFSAFVKQRFLVTTSTWSFATMNAFNFWAWHQDNLLRVPDSQRWFGVTEHTWGWILLAIAEAVACFLILLSDARSLQARARALLPPACVAVCAFFVLLTRIHERHLLPVLPLLALTCILAPEFWPLYVWLSASYLLNLHFSARGIFYMPEPVLGRPEVPLVSALNVLSLVLLAVLAGIREVRNVLNEPPDP